MAKKILCIIIVMITLVCILASCGHEHNFGEWETIKAATCTAEGSKARYCSCGDKITETIESTGHSYSDWNVTQAATCTTNGTRERTCKRCEQKEREIVWAHGYHSYGNWTIIQEATCTVDGRKERTCTCGEKDTMTIKASHQYEKGICTKCNKSVINIKLPTVPLTLKCGWKSAWNGTEYSVTLKITDIRWEANKNKNSEDYSVNFILTFDTTKCSNKDMFYGTIKIYDSQGYLVETSTFTISNLSTGDRIKDYKITNGFNLDENESYTVEITTEFKIS